MSVFGEEFEFDPSPVIFSDIAAVLLVPSVISENRTFTLWYRIPLGAGCPAAPEAYMTTPFPASRVVVAAPGDADQLVRVRGTTKDGQLGQSRPIVVHVVVRDGEVDDVEQGGLVHVGQQPSMRRHRIEVPSTSAIGKHRNTSW